MAGEWWNPYIRVPFKDRGRSMLGADCWGLACLVYQNELGIILPDYLDCYEHTEQKFLLTKLIKAEREAKWINPETPKPFDIAIVKYAGLPFHVGIVTKRGRMIHCAKDVGTSHPSYLAMDWKNKVIGFARHEQMQ